MSDEVIQEVKATEIIDNAPVCCCKTHNIIALLLNHGICDNITEELYVVVGRGHGSVLFDRGEEILVICPSCPVHGKDVIA